VTGYLQRLVTTAVQGEVGVQPIVRPWRIEVGVQERAWPEFAAEAEPHPVPDTTPTDGTAPGEDNAATVTTPVFDGAAPGYDRPPSAAGRVRDRTAAEPSPTPETMTPLFGPVPDADPGTRVPAARTGGVAGAPAVRRSRPGPSAGRPGGPARERDTEADPARSGPWPVMARRGPPVLPAFMPEPDRWPAVYGSAGEADRGDVEIHIGRIEVTAVSPPLAAPVAKAARKSINLNEYLRNGR
jgi:hypothetical protein